MLKSILIKVLPISSLKLQINCTYCAVVSEIKQKLLAEQAETCLDVAGTFLVVEELQLLVPRVLVLVGIGVSPASRPSVRSWASDASIGSLEYLILRNDDEVEPASVVAGGWPGSQAVTGPVVSFARGCAPAGSVAVIVPAPHELDRPDLALAATLPPLSRFPAALEPPIPLHGT